MGDVRLVFTTAYMANVIANIISNIDCDEHMKAFDIKRAEYVILSCMREHYVQAPEIAKQCIMVLQHLVWCHKCNGCATFCSAH